MFCTKNLVISGTAPDLQGEKLSKEFLQKYCRKMGKGRNPLHQGHDMGMPVVGYTENTRLIPDMHQPGEWLLVVDAYHEKEKIGADVAKGISISGIDYVSQPEQAYSFVCVPFPHYNDADFMGALSQNKRLAVGKWIKKQQDPSSVVLIGPILVLIIRPFWDEYCKQFLIPKIKNLILDQCGPLRKKGLSIELAQRIGFKTAGNKTSIVELRFAPGETSETEWLASLEDAYLMAINFANSDPKNKLIGINRLVLVYNSAHGCFELYRAEYCDGSVEQLC